MSQTEEREFGIGGNRLLDALVAKLACDGQVVEASAITVAEVDQLE